MIKRSGYTPQGDGSNLSTRKGFNRMKQPSSPGVLKIDRRQSEPSLTLVSHMDKAGATVTAITRRFEPGPVYCVRCPAGACRLTDNLCQIQVDRYVSEDDAPGYSAVGAVVLPPDGLADRDAVTRRFVR